MFGKLTFEALHHENTQNFAVIMMMLTGFGIAWYITYKKKWAYLWNEWITSVDPKKLGLCTSSQPF